MILKQSQSDGEGILHDHVEHTGPDLQPAGEVDADALQALPLTAGEGDGVFLIEPAQVLIAVHDDVDLVGSAHGHEALILADDALFVALEAELGLSLDLAPVDLLDHLGPDLHIRTEVFLKPF